MIVLLHIVIAIASLTYTAVLFAAPTKASFGVNYGLIAMTIVSGTYLIAATHTPMTETCVTGVAYLVIVTLGTVLARVRLAKAIATSRR